MEWAGKSQGDLIALQLQRTQVKYHIKEGFRPWMFL